MENSTESNDEVNFDNSISLHEAICTKMLSNNGSEEEHNLEKSMESCKITPTKVQRKNTDSIEECYYKGLLKLNIDSKEERDDEEPMESNSTENSAESQEHDRDESMELVEVTSEKVQRKNTDSIEECYYEGLLKLNIDSKEERDDEEPMESNSTVLSNNGSKEEHNLEESMESCEITPTKVQKENTDSKEERNYEGSMESNTNTSTENSAESQEHDRYESMELVEVTSEKVLSNNGSKEEHNLEESMESCEITPTKVQRKNTNSIEERYYEGSLKLNIDSKEERDDEEPMESNSTVLSNNGSKEKHNLEESMESCEITPTKVQKENTDSKEERNYEGSVESNTNTSIESSAESQQHDRDESMELVEVTSERNGAKIIYATDDYYGLAENLLKDDEPVCDEQTILANKINFIVDGWKTRKTQNKRHNFVIIQLAEGSNIHSICIDTACFIDSYMSQFSVQGGQLSKLLMEKTYLQDRKNRLGKSSTKKEYTYMQNKTENWNCLISLHELNHGYPSIRKRFFKVLPHDLVTHLRFNICPNGGIARLRAYGKVIPTITAINKEINLISSLYNSCCVSFSESAFYIGHPNNIIQPNKATSIIDGWEIKGKVHDEFNKTPFDQILPENWATFKLGCSGTVTHVVIDTRLFTGNAPCMVQVQGFSEQHALNEWKDIIPYIYVTPDTEQIITVEENRRFNVTNVKIIIKSNGGISRFRVLGIPESAKLING